MSASGTATSGRILRFRDRPWNGYPMGTKVHAITGGHWVRVKGGWKWFCGSTFPTPGAAWSSIELPEGCAE